MPLNSKSVTLFLLVLFISFLGLSAYIAYHPLIPIDIKISTMLQKYHSDWLDKIMLAISFFGEIPWSLLSVLVVAAIFYFAKFKIEAYFISLTLFSGLIILAVKNVIDRPRPTAFYVRLVEVNRFQSYPSGHVLSYVLFFGFLFILMRNLQGISSGVRKTVSYISLFLFITISPSRIYLGAHWFTDTVGGFLLGLICLYILCYFYFKKKNRVKNLT
jgi:membrane-associated phospholipid phosphatase